MNGLDPTRPENALFAFVTDHSRNFISRCWAAADSRKDLIAVD